MAKKRSNAVLSPNLGLYLDRPAVAVPDRALRDGNNFRIRDAALTNRLLGWRKLDAALAAANGPIRAIISFIPTGSVEKLVYITPTDVYHYTGAGTSRFLNPIYATGTVEVAGTAVTGTGTNWDPEAKIGDQIAFTDATEDDPEATWYTIQTVTDDTHIVLATSAGVVAPGHAYTIRKTFIAEYATHWDWDVFVNADGSGTDYLFITNGIDDVHTWDGSGGLLTNQGSVLGFTCKHLCSAFNMMLYFNIVYGGDELPTTLINSDVSTPLAAGDASAGLSGQFVVHNDPREIEDAQPLGDNLAVYSTRKVTLVQFLGDPIVFAFRQVGSGIGPIGPRVVADFGDYHEFIGGDTQYRFDGASLVPVNGHVWRPVLRNQDVLRRTLGFFHFDEETQELMWVLPYTTDPGTGQADDAVTPAVCYTQHYLEDVGDNNPQPFSKRDFPMTACGDYSAQDSTTWADLVGTWADQTYRWGDQSLTVAHPLSIAGDEDGNLWLLNSADNIDGEALASYVTFPKRPTSDGRMRALLSRVYPFVMSENSSEFNFNVSLLLADSEGGAEVETDAYPLDLGLDEGEYFVTPYRRARFYSLKMGSTGPSEPWVLDGYDLDFKPGGTR